MLKARAIRASRATETICHIVTVGNAPDRGIGFVSGVGLAIVGAGAHPVARAWRWRGSAVSR